jgi:hypothetical protein
MADIISDYAILIDADNTIGGSLPTGTRRANTSEVSNSYKIIIGKAPAMGTPFCNGISGLQFFALPAAPNFDGIFVIIGRNGSVPTYWGCSDVAALVAQCTALNNGSDEYTFGEGETGSLSAGNSATRIASCKLFLDLNGYALSNSNSNFLASYFI